MRNAISKKKYDTGTAYTMLFPIVIMLTIFVVVPFLYSIVMSFYDWSFYKESAFVGTFNYKLVLKDSKFLKSVWIGIKYALYVVPFQMIFAFLFAHVIRGLGKRASSLVKTTVYIPVIISGVITSIIFSFIYNYDGGLANYIIGLFGFDKVAWLAEVKTALGSIAMAGIWLGFGVTTLFMLAGLLDIPESYYEAADLEGAGSFTKMIHITIPLLKNVILYLLVTGLTGAIAQVELSLVMTNGGPLESTQTPNLYLLNHFRGDPTVGQTIAGSILLFVVLGSISAIIFRILNSEKAVDG